MTDQKVLLQQLLESAKKRLESTQATLKAVLAEIDTLEAIGAPIVELKRSRARRDRVHEQVKSAEELIATITKTKK